MRYSRISKIGKKSRKYGSVREPSRTIQKMARTGNKGGRIERERKRGNHSENHQRSHTYKKTRISTKVIQSHSKLF